MLAVKSGKPRQANLRRATSTAYYALFHCLAKCCADLFVGSQGSTRSMPAWNQVYRALEHGLTKNACKNQRAVKKFPGDIQDFANAFVSMQAKRHRADYDPSERFYKSSARQDIDQVADVLERFIACSVKNRRAFAAFVLFKLRP